MQSTLRKIKAYFDEKEYKKLYRTDSRPGLYYGIAKEHKPGKGEDLNELTVRPIISNIGTATYETAKYFKFIVSTIRKIGMQPS